MANPIPEPIASFRTTITNKITDVATTIYIDSVTDDDGNSMDTKILQFLIDKGLSTEEYILGTVDAATMSLTSVTRGLSVVDGATSVAGNKFEHRKKATIEISDHPALAMMIRRMNGTDAIDADNRPILDVDQDATDDKEFITQGQLNRAAMGGVTSSRVLVAGNAGETLAAGELVYLKAADGEWYLCDADTAGTVDNVLLGIAQGVGTDGVAVSGGILLAGVDTNQTGLTLGALQYASNTAGAISASPGTTEVTVGYAKSTTALYFAPRVNQMLTEDEQDALAGTSGTPSATNPFVTQSGLSFGGTGADGALNVTSGTTALDANGANILVKNYSSINIAAGATLTISNPAATGTVLWLRCSGAVTIAGTIEMSAMGAQSAVNGYALSKNSAVSYGGAVVQPSSDTNIGTAGIAGVKSLSNSTLTELELLSRRMLVFTGSGGSDGCDSYSGTNTGGAGGKGGGGLVIECAGALDFSGAINCNGEDGADGSHNSGVPAGQASGGGGGGACGSCLVLYNTLTANTGTVACSGGDGGDGGDDTGTGNSYSGVSGGGGGGSLIGAAGAGGDGGASGGASGVAGGAPATGAGGGGGGGAGAASGSSTATGGAGGTGADDSASRLIAVNTFF